MPDLCLRCNHLHDRHHWENELALVARPISPGNSASTRDEWVVLPPCEVCDCKGWKSKTSEAEQEIIV